MEKITLFNKEDVDSYPKFFPEGEDRELFNAIENDNLIIFYGAGVSVLAGAASWIQLAKNIIDKFPPDVYSHLEKIALKTIAKTDPKKAISICYHKVKSSSELLDKIYYASIKDSVTPKNPREFKLIHEKIFALDALAYVSTNIDKGFEAIKDTVELKKKTIFNLTNIDNRKTFIEIRNGNIFYLHGTIDQIEKTIFSVDNYLEFYNKQEIQTFLMRIFGGEYSVLFIGYSLDEYEILQNIFHAVDKQKKEIETCKHFLLTSIYTKDLAKFNVEKEYWKIFSVKAIPYFIDYEGYNRLKHVLDKLRAKIKELKPSTSIEFEKMDRI